MKTSHCTAILIFSAATVLAASASFGRELRPVLIESGPVQLSPASTVLAAPVSAVPVATTTPLVAATPVISPVLTPVLITTPTLITVTPIAPAIIIYPTNPIIFPTNPLSPP